MLTLGLVGCGGMGRRHIKGLQKLQGIGTQQFDLVGVCDPFTENAQLAADLAGSMLGHEPKQFGSLDELVAAGAGIDAIIVTTTPDTHARIGIRALDLGIHVMVEKPISLTVSQGIGLVEAAERNNRKLAVAENYRRDPVNRLAKAVVDSGVLGSIYLMIQSSSGAGERVIITPWRHKRESGGIVVDMGIHYADIFEYFLGPIDSVFGMNGVVDKQRVDASDVWHDADAEDLSIGVARFASGAIGNWVIDLAGRGTGHFTRTIHGTSGTLAIPQDRTGKPLHLSLRRDGIDEVIGPQELLTLVPEYRLQDVTARLFDGDRIASYELPFADVDANLLAIEQDDFALAILEDRLPEVDGAFGLRSLAIAYGFIEAEHMGRSVAIETLLTNVDTPYQTEIDAMLAANLK